MDITSVALHALMFALSHASPSPAHETASATPPAPIVAAPLPSTRPQTSGPQISVQAPEIGTPYVEYSTQAPDGTWLGDPDPYDMYSCWTEINLDAPGYIEGICGDISVMPKTIVHMGLPTPEELAYGLQEDSPAWDCKNMGNKICGPMTGHTDW